MRRTQQKEYGDFQTPDDLAERAVALLRDYGVAPDVVIEPTCGKGSFLLAAARGFSSAQTLVGFDINEEHLAVARKRLSGEAGKDVRIQKADFFQTDWDAKLAGLRGHLLFLGNPPWVTNAALSGMASENLPAKANFKGERGLAAKTGKGNFDISEWMILRLLKAVNGREATLAMLCKTSTARRVLEHLWRTDFPVVRSAVHLIDAAREFGVAVDAGMFLVQIGKKEGEKTAAVYAGVDFAARRASFGYVGEELVSDVAAYRSLCELNGRSPLVWRSGIKHDASAVMEFRREGGALINGLGEIANIEENFVFPLVKSSDLANGRLHPNRCVLVPQQTPATDTERIQTTAPKTWNYLCRHGDVLDKRRSVIYANRPRFAIFGIGKYAFAEWKVAVSGLYKNARFSVVGPENGKPAVLDDTCYFIPCPNEKFARHIEELLNADEYQRFLHALLFLDSKRPVTADLLNRIDFSRLSRMNPSVLDMLDDAAQRQLVLF